MDLKVGNEKSTLNIILSSKGNEGQASRSSGWLEAEETNGAGASEATADCVILTFTNPAVVPASDGAEMSFNFKDLGKDGFKIFDSNGDGAVSRSEWKQLNMNEEAFDVISRGQETFDQNSWNTCIDQLEVAQVNIQKNPASWSQFEFFATDLNRDGKVSRVEWQMAGGQAEIFDSISKDGQCLTIEKWNQFMNQLGG